jgi:multiple sugar transport system substrate-binding protein
MNHYAVRWKTLLVVSLLALGFVSFAAAAQEKTVLRVMDWKLNETGATQAWFQYVKERFEAEHPGVVVEYHPMPWSEAYRDQLVTSSIAGVPPDVVSLSIIWANDLYRAGVLMPLNDYVAKDPDVGPEAMIPATQVYNQWEGVIFGITHTMDENVLFYDIDALEEVGLSADPYAIQSWDDMITYARRLTVYDDAGNVVRAGYEPDFWDTAFTSWLTANGGSFYNATLTGPAFHDEAGRQTLQFLHDLRNVYRVTGGDTPMSVMNGTAAMVTSGNWAAYTAQQQRPDLNFNMTSFPAGPNGVQRGTTVWGNMYSIPVNAANPDLAWEFIRWYTSLEGNLEMLKFLDYIASPRLDFYQTDEWRAVAAEYHWAPRVPEIAIVGGTFAFLRNTEFMNQAFRPYLMQAYLGNMPVETALEQAARIVERLLAE